MDHFRVLIHEPINIIVHSDEDRKFTWEGEELKEVKPDKKESNK